jgi:cytochrome c oxidase subunit IV
MSEHAQRRPFRSVATKLVLAWLALLALMTTSLASAYVALGVGNLIAGLAIAAIKTSIVVWLFMDLRIASGVVRAVAAVAAVMLAVLFTLSGVDYRTRLHEPAAVQSPRQIEPLVADDDAAHDVPR